MSSSDFGHLGFTRIPRSRDARAWEYAMRVPRLLARPLAQGVSFHLNKVGLGAKIAKNEDGQVVRDVRENLKLVERNARALRLTDDVHGAAARLRDLLNTELHEHDSRGLEAIELITCARVVAEAMTRDRELVEELVSYEDGLCEVFGVSPRFARVGNDS